MDKKPFDMSSSNVMAAKDFLPVLKTFVAPILPEPISLKSFFKNKLVNINPKGIEPNK